MSSLLPVIGVLFAAAITPGPNNIIVMQAGARGMAPAIRAVLGVVCGSMVLLIFTWFGFGLATSVAPALTLVLHIFCAAYLAWMGVALLTREQTAAADAAVPSNPLGIAAFQLLNPKAWILVATAVAAMPRERSLALLALLMVAVTGACLMLWALAGTAATHFFARPAARRVIDRILGPVLVLSAVGIAAELLST
ncbi:LysE family translocator [Peristeroidobacter agariperforans]|uniref:LysE family translocator n=1 Tax=Peristeroidobacter agariperforans TaxID=268404 RepID=UPI00101DD9B6|nr:LysE family translocator [Peristeroidobacter agariperforans]